VNRWLPAALTVVAVSLACACSHRPYEIAAEDRERFRAGIIDVASPGKPPLIEGLDNCVLWKAQYDGDRISGWKAALGADWGGRYPAFMTGCMDQAVHYRNGEVRVYLCTRAIGAGGGCNNGGYYRSRTGERPWLQSWNQIEWWVLPQ